MNFLKKEVKNKKLVLLTAITLIIFIIGSIIIISNNLEVIWPTAEILDAQKSNLRRAKNDLQKAQILHEKFMQEENSVLKKVKTFYKENDKIKADIYMRQRIEHAAKFSNLILKSTSSIRKKEIKKGTSSLEVSISAEGGFEKVIIFFQELNKKKIGLYWVNCYLRPSTKKGETLINISGVLRMVSTDGKLFKKPKGKAVK
jgi:Tfp pilus assembly protein PilE